MKLDIDTHTYKIESRCPTLIYLIKDAKPSCFAQLSSRDRGEMLRHLRCV